LILTHILPPWSIEVKLFLICKIVATTQPHSSNHRYEKKNNVNFFYFFLLVDLVTMQIDKILSWKGFVFYLKVSGVKYRQKAIHNRFEQF
jgi:hypothetical protein